jgi:3-mercaptopyruvate sulfurtransferase SseA
MRYFLLCILLAVAPLLGCNQQPTNNSSVASATPANTPTSRVVDNHEDENVARIAVEEAKAEFDKGNALFVDARPAAAYEMEHIKGAVNITSATLDEQLNTLPKNKKIIVYCS